MAGPDTREAQFLFYFFKLADIYELETHRKSIFNLNYRRCAHMVSSHLSEARKQKRSNVQDRLFPPVFFTAARPNRKTYRKTHTQKKLNFIFLRLNCCNDIEKILMLIL